MVRINFYPESAKPEYIKAASEYKEIWEKEGKAIVDSIRKYTGLELSKKTVNAVIADNVSQSVPMVLEFGLNGNEKKCTLIHELIHRLMVDNNFWITGKLPFTELVHRVLDVVLYDILTDLYGEEVARENVKHEISYGDKNYKKAWNWAMSLSKEGRKKEFGKMKLDYLGKAPQD